MRGTARTAAGMLFAATLAGLGHRVLRITQQPSWPPGPDAVTSAAAQQAVEAFVAPDAGPRAAALPFAWSTAAAIEPWVDGERFFPRVFADIEAARSSVHVLMFGWREGEVGMRMASLLEDKLAAGLEVRIIVDGLGSRPYAQAREMFGSLAAAGAQIVVNDVLPPVRHGLYPHAELDWRPGHLGRADHRKLYVIDGQVAWTGGAGIEDHFADGRFHDVMVRVTGDVVRQAQAAFLTSFHGHGGPPAPDLARLFPEPEERGATPVALTQVIPGGFVAATLALREQIDRARERIDVMNPYLTDDDAIGRLVAAARRGVKVRIVVARKSNNALAAAALRHRYAELTNAGAEVWELPGTVVHAKVLIADDVVCFGTVNLDAWALYRNSEIMMLASDRETAERFEERLFAPDIDRSERAEPPSTLKARATSALGDRLRYFL